MLFATSIRSWIWAIHSSTTSRLFVVVVLFYGIIAIHDIPAQSGVPPSSPTRTRSTRVFTLHALWPFLWSGPWRTGTSTGGGSRTNPPRLVQSQRPTRANWRICGAASQSSKTA